MTLSQASFGSQILIGAVALFVCAASVQAKTICTALADADSGKILLAEGDCDTRVTPASTFKIPLSLMGYDSGFLQDAHTPTLAFQKGDVDWGGDNWRQPTDATRWMKYSVVWFSQRIAHFLGADRLHAYAVTFSYGNADFSGDPGKNNGLERAWIASSLKVSPLEQVAFLKKLVKGELPVSAQAMDKTRAIVEETPLVADGWRVQGKTGMAYPRMADGSFDEAHGWGWYVGWATHAGRTVVFARLTQDEGKQPISAGVRTRDALVKELPTLIGSLSTPH